MLYNETQDDILSDTTPLSVHCQDLEANVSDCPSL